MAIEFPSKRYMKTPPGTFRAVADEDKEREEQENKVEQEQKTTRSFRSLNIPEEYITEARNFYFKEIFKKDPSNRLNSEHLFS